MRHTPDDERLRADAAPVGKSRRGVEIADPLDEARGVERLEEAGTFEIRRNDAGDVGGKARVVAEERRYGDGPWAEIGLIETLSGLFIVLLIGLLTVGWQVRQAAIQNPADLLRDE